MIDDGARQRAHSALAAPFWLGTPYVNACALDALASHAGVAASCMPEEAVCWLGLFLVLYTFRVRGAIGARRARTSLSVRWQRSQSGPAAVRVID